eukprot:g2087.t1
MQRTVEEAIANLFKKCMDEQNVAASIESLKLVFYEWTERKTDISVWEFVKLCLKADLGSDGLLKFEGIAKVLDSLWSLNIYTPAQMKCYTSKRVDDLGGFPVDLLSINQRFMFKAIVQQSSSSSDKAQQLSTSLAFGLWFQLLDHAKYSVPHLSKREQASIAIFSRQCYVDSFKDFINDDDGYVDFTKLIDRLEKQIGSPDDTLPPKPPVVKDIRLYSYQDLEDLKDFVTYMTDQNLAVKYKSYLQEIKRDGDVKCRRATAVMKVACGGGKSIMALAVGVKCDDAYKLLLGLTWSGRDALLKKEKKFRMLLVSCDEGMTEWLLRSNNIYTDTIKDICQITNTTDEAVINSWFNSTDANNVDVVIGTYQSSDKLHSPSDRYMTADDVPHLRGYQFSLAVYDEYHQTVGLRIKDYCHKATTCAIKLRSFGTIAMSGTPANAVLYTDDDMDEDGEKVEDNNGDDNMETFIVFDEEESSDGCDYSSRFDDDDEDGSSSSSNEDNDW